MSICHRWLASRGLPSLTNIYARRFSMTQECMAQTSQKDDEIDDTPVKYTESDAHKKWRAAYGWRDPAFEQHTPPSQRNIVIFSMASVLIYFCFLREENDVDEELYQPLFVTVPELEKPLIEAAIKTFRSAGKDSSELERKLAEINHREKLKAIVESKSKK